MSYSNLIIAAKKESTKLSKRKESRAALKAQQEIKKRETLLTKRSRKEFKESSKATKVEKETKKKKIEKKVKRPKKKQRKEIIISEGYMDLVDDIAKLEESINIDSTQSSLVVGKTKALLFKYEKSKHSIVNEQEIKPKIPIKKAYFERIKKQKEIESPKPVKVEPLVKPSPTLSDVAVPVLSDTPKIQPTPVPEENTLITTTPPPSPPRMLVMKYLIFYIICNN